MLHKLYVVPGGGGDTEQRGEVKAAPAFKLYNVAIGRGGATWRRRRAAASAPPHNSIRCGGGGGEGKFLVCLVCAHSMRKF